MRTARNTTPTHAPWGPWDRAAMWLILGGSIVYAGIVLVAGITHLVAQLTSRTWSGTLLVENPLPASADAGSATLIEGNYETASVTLGNLGDLSFGTLTVALIVSVLTTAIVAVSFVYLSWRLLRAEPFKKSLTYTFITAGSALVIGTTISLGFDTIGRMMTVSELMGEETLEGFWPVAATGDLSPIGFGFALLIVACAFEYGERLSRQTDGLV